MPIKHTPAESRLIQQLRTLPPRTRRIVLNLVEDWMKGHQKQQARKTARRP